MRQMKQAKPRLAYDYLDKRINIVFNARRLMDLIAKTDDIAKRWAKKLTGCGRIENRPVSADLQ